MVEEEQQRPDPDSLLALANEKPRGRLKVFFGACAGVGKTYPHSAAPSGGVFFGYFWQPGHQ